MSNLDFGVVATIVGMGTTFATLIFLGLIMDLLKRLFPIEEAVPAKKPAPSAPTADKS
ncbi:MAG: OadG family protein [Chloroflexota bacterium]